MFRLKIPSRAFNAPYPAIFTDKNILLNNVKCSRFTARYNLQHHIKMWKSVIEYTKTVKVT